MAGLDCAICLDRFTPPIYQCGNGHSFCLACLQQSVAVGNVNCPSCRVPLPLNGQPVGAAPSLVRNRHLEEVLGTGPPDTSMIQKRLKYHLLYRKWQVTRMVSAFVFVLNFAIVWQVARGRGTDIGMTPPAASTAHLQPKWDGVKADDSVFSILHRCRRSSQSIPAGSSASPLANDASIDLECVDTALVDLRIARFVDLLDRNPALKTDPAHAAVLNELNSLELEAAVLKAGMTQAVDSITTESDSEDRATPRTRTAATGDADYRGTTTRTTPTTATTSSTTADTDNELPPSLIWSVTVGVWNVLTSPLRLVWWLITGVFSIGWSIAAAIYSWFRIMTLTAYSVGGWAWEMTCFVVMLPIRLWFALLLLPFALISWTLQAAHAIVWNSAHFVLETGMKAGFALILVAFVGVIAKAIAEHNELVARQKNQSQSSTSGGAGTPTTSSGGAAASGYEPIPSPTPTAVFSPSSGGRYTPIDPSPQAGAAAVASFSPQSVRSDDVKSPVSQYVRTPSYGGAGPDSAGLTRRSVSSGRSAAPEMVR